MATYSIARYVTVLYGHADEIYALHREKYCISMSKIIQFNLPDNHTYYKNEKEF
jgi:hypothetical protein